MKVKKVKSVKENIFLDGSLTGRGKIVSKIKDIIEPLGVPWRDNDSAFRGNY